MYRPQITSYAATAADRPRKVIGKSIAFIQDPGEIRSPARKSRGTDQARPDPWRQSGGQSSGIHASNDGWIMIFAGGIPLKKDGKVVGAIGVSGGSGDQDHAVAEAGAAAF